MIKGKNYKNHTLTVNDKENIVNCDVKQIIFMLFSS